MKDIPDFCGLYLRYMHRDNWDDLRFFLAVAEAGSVSGAARSLGVNHATVLRRIAALEARTGAALFDRTARGYDLPAGRARVLEAARDVEAAIQSLGRALHGAQAPLSGEVRVTSTDSFCQYVLPPIVAELVAEAPDLRITLLCSNAHSDMGRIQAEIAVRPALTLPEDLTGESPARLGFAAYRAKAGQGRSVEGWLGMTGPLARSAPGRWLAERADTPAPGGSADSFLVLREMAAAGLGIAILPVYLGRGDARLDHLPKAMPPISVPVWVASHADLADVPRIALLRARLCRALGAASAMLEG